MKIAFLGNFGVEYSSENHHAKSLEALGNEVIRLQEGRTGWQRIVHEARDCDLFVWVHTHGWEEPGMLQPEEAVRQIKAKGIPVITYHLDLWMGLQRQRDLERDPFYSLIDWFFTTDRMMADYFNMSTTIKGEYLPAGVYHEECYMEAPEQPMNDVIFVGSKGYHPEWPYRPKLVNWLADTYGDGFKHYGGDGLGTVRGKELNQLYANSKVAVGDSLVSHFTYPYYWSDRVYETMGRGGFLIMPHITGLDEQFEDGKHVVLYEFNDFKNLKKLIDYYVENDDARERIRKAGHEEVKNKHTYFHRWNHILNTVFDK